MRGPYLKILRGDSRLGATCGVVAAMARHLGGPDEERIAERLWLDPRTVRRALDELNPEPEPDPTEVCALVPVRAIRAHGPRRAILLSHLWWWGETPTRTRAIAAHLGWKHRTVLWWLDTLESEGLIRKERLDRDHWRITVVAEACSKRRRTQLARLSRRRRTRVSARHRPSPTQESRGDQTPSPIGSEKRHTHSRPRFPSARGGYRNLPSRRSEAAAAARLVDELLERVRLGYARFAQPLRMRRPRFALRSVARWLLERGWEPYQVSWGLENARCGFRADTIEALLSAVYLGVTAGHGRGRLSREEVTVKAKATRLFDDGPEDHVAPGDRAGAITKRYWAKADPKPHIPFVALRQVVAKLLDSGWDPVGVEAALGTARGYTVAAIEAELARRNVRKREVGPYAPNGDGSQRVPTEAALAQRLYHTGAADAIREDRPARIDIRPIMAEMRAKLARCRDRAAPGDTVEGPEAPEAPEVPEALERIVELLGRGRPQEVLERRVEFVRRFGAPATLPTERWAEALRWCEERCETSSARSAEGPSSRTPPSDTSDTSREPPDGS
ncbi:MAG: hypothetical protein KatS3mg014_2520 [Actinomycetota bacterium]|nr:MAG: hypothetical protein KatS3mg014_2485 [Actinomycetota bacterium]GIV00905.1 MAG: hypothetical protein KatS3mg014_2520 [Actinomycetota bacterium]